MRRPIHKAMIQEIVGEHINKLPHKGLDERYALPIDDMFTLLMGDQFAGGVSRLGCRDLENILEEFNFQLGTTLSAYRYEVGDVLASKVKDSIDNLIGFDPVLFDKQCAKYKFDIKQCHVLMPLHVSDLLRGTLDDNQSLYGIDGHIYLSREYLGEYGISYANSFSTSHRN